jgi:putative DNA primase/helicase
MEAFMADYSLNGLDISTEEFISAFAEPHEIVYIRVFSDRPKEDSIFTGCKYEQKQAQFSQLTECLQQHNSRNRGIFFAVNHGGHDGASITRINAQFAEIDNLPLEEQLELISKFLLPPSLIVKTRESLHCLLFQKSPLTPAMVMITPHLWASECSWDCSLSDVGVNSSSFASVMQRHFQSRFGTH